MHRQRRTVLVVGMGTSPAVLTETVWALAHSKEPGVDMLAKLHRVCSQADHAVWYPGTLTRLAGAIRKDTGKLQTLIFAQFPRS